MRCSAHSISQSVDQSIDRSILYIEVAGLMSVESQVFLVKLAPCACTVRGFMLHYTGLWARCSENTDRSQPVIIMQKFLICSYSKVDECYHSESSAEVTYVVHSEEMPSREQLYNDLAGAPCACQRDCCGHWCTSGIETYTANDELRVRVHWVCNI
jgi:hypothetical protein